jgi:DNA-binding response OmpR family regulator
MTASMTATHVLLIEDDPALANLVRDELCAFGHQVRWVNDGALVESALSPEISLVLLDLMLPGVHGLELCKRIRASSKVPIIMLTARGSEADRVSGLELGADDYIVKPFSLRELIARCHAQLRRAGWQQPAVPALEVAPGNVERYLDCEIDRAALRASVSGEVIALSAKEFEMLCVLVDAPGRALTREWLLTRVWGRDYDGSDRTVDNHVLKLREKLGRDSLIANAICAIRGVGYRLERW